MEKKFAGSGENAGADFVRRGAQIRRTAVSREYPRTRASAQARRFQFPFPPPERAKNSMTDPAADSVISGTSRSSSLEAFFIASTEPK